MAILLLDDTLHVEIYYEETDSEFKDNICISIWESCPDEEKIFRGEKTHLYVTPEQSRQLATALNKAAAHSRSSRGK